MTDYISREAAIELLQAPITMSICLSKDECLNKRDQRVVDLALIKSVPAADVREVVRGKWREGVYGRAHLICSACDYEWMTTEKTNFCPNCGAKMT